jgi:hypothetical protein
LLGLEKVRCFSSPFGFWDMRQEKNETGEGCFSPVFFCLKLEKQQERMPNDY